MQIQLRTFAPLTRRGNLSKKCLCSSSLERFIAIKSISHFRLLMRLESLHRHGWGSSWISKFSGSEYICFFCSPFYQMRIISGTTPRIGKEKMMLKSLYLSITRRARDLEIKGTVWSYESSTEERSTGFLK